MGVSTIQVVEPVVIGAVAAGAEVKVVVVAVPAVVVSTRDIESTHPVGRTMGTGREGPCPHPRQPWSKGHPMPCPHPRGHTRGLHRMRRLGEGWSSMLRPAVTNITTNRHPPPQFNSIAPHPRILIRFHTHPYSTGKALFVKSISI